MARSKEAEVPKVVTEAPIDDEALVARCKRDDRAAFDELMIRYQEEIFRLAVRMINDRERARDIAQECFLRAFRAIKNFRGQSSFSTWIYRITLNLCYNERHSRRRAMAAATFSLNVGSDEDESSIDLPDGSQEPGATASTSELQDKILRAIESLDEAHRTVVILRDINDQSYQEIAKVLGCPVGTVRSRLHRARMELRDLLADLA
jgi:RNA polymerase sigma-70 factor (ECF subfamily)